MDDERRIAAVDELSEDDTFLFTVRNGDGEEREAILVRLADGVAGWLNYCRHFTHIRLDKGSGATMRNGEIVCTNHGAMFEVDTGNCTFGPCEGATLEAVDVTVADGAVTSRIPTTRSSGPAGSSATRPDLSSTSNVEF